MLQILLHEHIATTPIDSGTNNKDSVVKMSLKYFRRSILIYMCEKMSFLVSQISGSFNLRSSKSENWVCLQSSPMYNN